MHRDVLAVLRRGVGGRVTLVSACVDRVDQLAGIGRRMPWTTAAFTIGALGMIGVPPLAGFVSKWFLAEGAAIAGNVFVLSVISISTVLNAMYFLPLLHAAWFGNAEDPTPVKEFAGTHWLLSLPGVVTASLALAAGLAASAAMSPLEWTRFIASREYAQ